MTGKLIGVGTGPGDPELLTLKAVRAIQTADVVAYFAKKGNSSNARGIVADLITTQIEEPLGYPVTTEIDRRHADYKSATAGFYEEAAARVAAHLDAGRTVAVLSEGDPLFYGSYMHIHARLAHRYPTEVVAGITAMSGCWSQAGLPLVQGDDILSVLPGTLEEGALRTRLDNTD
ncbi:MAG: precorrin-2 C(20)-methyltransferase, partial [Alphaproteobacteria bacterium]|nr:precorrin-2 C(20)-methyltransferase [Alphaproteobacteria bacterium]